MTILGRITVTLSDDERYTAGQSYDVVLQTPASPDPANLVTGSLDAPPPSEAASAPPASS